MMLVAATSVVVTILATLAEVEKNQQPNPLETRAKLHYWPNPRPNETTMRNHEVDTK
jgi:hypothetical protein